MFTAMQKALAVLALAVVCLAPDVRGDGLSISFGMTYSGDGTYYGDRTRGFGHCSFHMHGFGSSQGYAGTPLAINAAQYTGTSVCGLCVKYRGVGQGLGGSPVSTSWQKGFICDSCPECKFGDIDQQMGGDGRWKVEWFPMQCPVGSSTFKFGFQGGNPWYKKLMIANARVPLKNVRLYQDGGWVQLTKTIDNYWEYHGDVSRAWNPCAKIQVTSILGDTVTDTVCCTDGTCEGKAQFPCRSDLPSDDCSSKGPGKINVGGIGRAGQDYNKKAASKPKKAAAVSFAGSAAAAVKSVVSGIGGLSVQAGDGVVSGGVGVATDGLTASFSLGGQQEEGRDMSAARVATNGGSNKGAKAKMLKKGEQCGGNAYDCWKYGNGACQDKKFRNAYCANGLKCKRNDQKWWGCNQ